MSRLVAQVNDLHAPLKNAGGDKVRNAVTIEVSGRQPVASDADRRLGHIAANPFDSLLPVEIDAEATWKQFLQVSV